MENIPPARRGPAPDRGSDSAPPLSGQRAAVLEHLQQVSAPTTVQDVADRLSLHVNTVREHLDALVERGLAVRDRAPARGRGRPAWTYQAAPDNPEPDVRVREYAGLATALAAHIARTSTDPGRDAQEAGRTWGRQLATAAAPASTGGTAADARRAVVTLLDDLGFDPLSDDRATTAALRRCPLLDAARKYPEVVCQVHLGIVRGAMDVLGGNPERTDLVPFAEPGACRLHLVTRA